MSKYKCIYNLNRECLAVPQGLSCSEICYKAYQQGRADKEKELSELPNEYSEKLWKIAFEKGFKKGVEDTQMRIDTLREDAIEEYKKALNKEFEKVDKKFLHWLDFVEMYNKVAEQLKEKSDEQKHKLLE